MNITPKTNSEDFANEDQLERVVGRIRCSTPTQQSVDSLQAWATQLQKASPARSLQKNSLNTRRWFNIAMAASMLIVVSIASMLSTSSLAVAQIRNAIRKVDNVTIQCYYGKGEQRHLAETVIIRGNKVRWVRPDGLTHQTDLDSNTEVTVDENRRTAEYYPLYDSSERRQTVEQIFRTLGNLSDDAFVKSQEIESKSYTVSWDGMEVELCVDSDSLPKKLTILKANQQNLALVGQQAEFTYEPVGSELLDVTVPDDFVVTKIERKPARNSIDLNLVPGKGFDKLPFQSSFAQVLEYCGAPDGVERSTRVVHNFSDQQADIYRTAQERGLENMASLDPELFGLPFSRVDELIYDSQGFRIIVDEFNGFEQVTVYAEGELGGRNRGFAGTIDGSIRLGDKPETVLKQLGEPSSRSGLDETNWNGGLSYLDPFMNFGFRDLRLSSVTFMKGLVSAMNIEGTKVFVNPSSQQPEK